MDCLLILIHKVGQGQNFEGQGHRSIYRATGRLLRSSAYNLGIIKFFEKVIKQKESLFTNTRIFKIKRFCVTFLILSQK